MLSPQPIRTHPTAWTPDQAKVTLHVSLDACFAPSATGTRLDAANLVVLDDFIDESIRSELLAYITEQGWDHDKGPPRDKWTDCTRDTPDARNTWGLQPHVLESLQSSDLAAKLEIQSRLAKLYPEVDIYLQPSDDIQDVDFQAYGSHPTRSGVHGAVLNSSMEHPSTAHSKDLMGSDTANSSEQESLHHQKHENLDTGQWISVKRQKVTGTPDNTDEAKSTGVCSTNDRPRYDCHAMLANAAVCGDEYQWHQDADPQTFPETSAFAQQHGQYTNREPGKPLFVSLLLYLNDSWPRDWGADTLFLDVPSDTGIVVRPKPYRAVLMDQDVVHKLTPPASQAGGRPRYSLVWKLMFVPKRSGQPCSISRPEWGPPDPFGSAAKVQAIVRQMAAQRKVHQTQGTGSKV